jgi:hypothetical protein
MPNVSQLVPVIGGSCSTAEDCARIDNSMCKSDSTCVCAEGFVEDTTNKTCLPGTLTLILLMWRIGWANIIPIYSYIQQVATLHSLFISGNRSTCFGWYFHPSSGSHTTVSTASGICHTITAICRYRGRVGTCLSVLWVAYATQNGSNSSTIAADSSNGVTNTRCCRYSCMRSWW